MFFSNININLIIGFTIISHLDHIVNMCKCKLTIYSLFYDCQTYVTRKPSGSISKKAYLSFTNNTYFCQGEKRSVP